MTPRKLREAADTVKVGGFAVSEIVRAVTAHLRELDPRPWRVVAVVAKRRKKLSPASGTRSARFRGDIDADSPKGLRRRVYDRLTSEEANLLVDHLVATQHAHLWSATKERRP